MNAIDIIILSIIGLSVIISFVRGIIQEIFSLGALIVGFIVASIYSDYTAVHIKTIIKNYTIANAICFLIIFLISSIVIIFLGKLIKKLFRASPLAFADRIGGAIFGLIKGVLIIGVALMVINAFVPLEKSFLRDSKTAPFILSGVKKVASFIGSLHAENIYNEFKKKMPFSGEKGYVFSIYYRRNGEALFSWYYDSKIT